MISLVYTTARPGIAGEHLRRWHQAADKPDETEVIITVDEPHSIDSPFRKTKVVVNTGRRDCVTGWNLACQYATGDIFIQVSDDLFPPQHWDSMLDGLIPPLTALHISDERGFVTAVFHPVLHRSCWEHFGFLYPPEFESMYCDVWLYWAYSRAKFLRRVDPGHLRFTHVHRTTHDVEWDDVLRRHESVERYARGKAILDRLIEEAGNDASGG